METLYEMTVRLGKGQGEGMMWDTVKAVSEAVDAGMSEKDKEALMARIYGMLSGGHFDEDHAVEAVSKMGYVDKDGDKRSAPYWTIPEVSDVYESVKDRIPSCYNEWDFYVTMNWCMSRYRMLLEDWFPKIDAEELAVRLSDLAVNFLSDEDSPFGKKKIWGYLHGQK